MPTAVQNRIEIWRSEVSSQTSSASGSVAERASVKQVGFWRRIFGLKGGAVVEGEGEGGLGAGLGMGIGMLRRRGEVERTRMYNVRSIEKEEVSRGGRKLNRDDDDGGSSMELGETDESEGGGLKDRRERLERAAKLLDRSKEVSGDSGGT
ncbi:hypothetical protein CJF32_00000257 [Rutstroemia sp. NJR-2017a WRK4]|nr:hypothetical protein CJF32_00000257 [Rutstroemia sp. NJR-2017a WRK4]